MTNTENERLKHLLADSEREVAKLREGGSGTVREHDEARIVDEISGDDGGTNPFAAAVRATRMPMVISNPRLPDNPIVFVNDAFCRLCGYPRDEIVGRNCRFLQGPDTDGDTVARIREAMRDVTIVHVDVLNYRKGTPTAAGTCIPHRHRRRLSTDAWDG